MIEFMSEHWVIIYENDDVWNRAISRIYQRKEVTK